jgi:hypothetical protein
MGMGNPHNTMSAKPSHSQKAHDTKKETALKAVAAAAAQLSLSHNNTANNSPSPQPLNNVMSGMGMGMVIGIGMNSAGGSPSPQSSVHSYGGGGGDGANMGMGMNMNMGNMSLLDRQTQSLRTFHPSPNLPLPHAMHQRFHSVGSTPAPPTSIAP